VCDHNGETGMSLTLQDSRLEQNQTNDNSWRFGPGWAEGGLKLIGGNPSGNVIIGHVAKDNQGSGVWLDTCGGNNRVERCWLEGNMISGLEFEACVGEGNVGINNVICKTREIPNALYPAGGGTGILLYESGNVALCNNTVVDNEHSGITFAGSRRGNGGSCANERVYDNIISHNGAAGMVFWVWGQAAQPSAMHSDVSDYNLWDEPGASIAILPGGASPINSLADWRTTMGQDSHSLEGNPQFISADGGDYHLRPDSPALKHGSPAAESGVVVSDDFDGHARAAGHAATLGAFGD
jgi:parallel beta-helix repeat protein